MTCFGANKIKYLGSLVCFFTFFAALLLWPAIFGRGGGHRWTALKYEKVCFTTGMCIKIAKTSTKKLFRTSALSSDGLHPGHIWLAIITGLQIVCHTPKAIEFICIEKCTFYCDFVSFCDELREEPWRKSFEKYRKLQKSCKNS